MRHTFKLFAIASGLAGALVLNAAVAAPVLDGVEVGKTTIADYQKTTTCTLEKVDDMTWKTTAACYGLPADTVFFGIQDDKIRMVDIVYQKATNGNPFATFYQALSNKYGAPVMTRVRMGGSKVVGWQKEGAYVSIHERRQDTVGHVYYVDDQYFADQEKAKQSKLEEAQKKLESML